MKGRTERYILLGVLFLVNAAEMILELVAARVMSPYFGTSNFVWTAIIGIILLSGSFGNLFGGKLSEKYPAYAVLLPVFAAASIFVALIPTAGPVLLTFIKRRLREVRLASVTASVLLFLLPSAAIGTVTPVVMKYMLSDCEDVGFVSGELHAIIAIGSLAGTFVGGFWLIPAMGTKLILLVIAFCLLIMALPFLRQYTWRMLIPFAFAAAVLIVGLIVSLREDRTYSATGELRTYEDGINIDTEYGRIIVRDGMENGEPVRYYTQSGAYESATFLREEMRNELVYEYVKAYDRAFEYTSVGDTLMIGGAAYQYPKYFISHFPWTSMDVVEIDPMATQIAKEYFFLDDLIEQYDTERSMRLGLITADGRVYLSETDKRYSVIFNDAFSGETPVAVLSTREAAQLIRDHLKDGGLYLSNVLGAQIGPKGAFLRSEVRTLETVFPYVYLIPCYPDDPPDFYSNYMVICSNDPLDVPDSISIIDESGDVILTDDYCPVDQLIAASYFG